MNNETPKKLPLLGIPYICRFLKPHRKVIAVIIIFMGLGSLIESCFPLFQIYAINNFALGQNLGNIPYFIAAYIGLLLIQGVINGIGSYASCAAEVYVDRDIKQICFEHVQRLSLTYFNRHGVGYIHSRVIADADKIGIIVSWNLMDIVIDVCYLFGISIIMLRLNFTLGIILIMAVPVEILITALFTGLMADENRKVREHNSRITGSFNEGVTGAETIKTLAIENKMIDGFKTETLAMKLAAIRAGRFKAFFNSSIIFCSGLALSIVLWRGGIIASEGVMLIGTLSVFMNYALSITAYIQALVGTVSNLIGTAVNIERVADLLATEPEIIESDEALRRYGDIFDDANADAGNADAAGAGGASDPGLDIAA
ncbi:MAG: ABC transporter transmembrane domain-containing protein, partial [Eubacteriales bacterium]|nr:ABC transporter transmembrane domain-containing protein [Eubacteriales bacterium]